VLRLRARGEQSPPGFRGWERRCTHGSGPSSRSASTSWTR
jgi:hypothetical protein